MILPSILLSTLQSARRYKISRKRFQTGSNTFEPITDSSSVPGDISNLNYREVLINHCRVFQKVDNDSVFVVHVLSQESDLRMFLRSNENEN